MNTPDTSGRGYPGIYSFRHKRSRINFTEIQELQIINKFSSDFDDFTHKKSYTKKLFLIKSR